MWDVDANVFVIRMMRQTLERRFIQWMPSSRICFHPQQFKKEDAYVEKHISNISAALEKLSRMELKWDVEEFEHLQMELGWCQEDFIDFFVNSVSTCYLKNYSPFNFIRFLRYIIDFSIVCFSRGFSDVFDYAAVSIAQIIFRYGDVFIDFVNWQRVIKEAGRILRADFQHPYFSNRFLHDKNALKHGDFNVSRY